MVQPRRQLATALVALTGLVGLFNASAALAEGDVWTPRAPMSPPRRLLAAAAHEGKIYTFGGCGSPCFEPPLHASTDEETRVQVYDPAEDLPGRNPWREKQRMSAILFGAAAAAPGKGKIFTFGGYVTPNLTQEYHPATDTWRKRRSMPTPRHGHAAVAFEGKVYVLGGSNGNSPSNALEVYDPGSNTWTSGPPMPTARVFLAAAVLDGKIFAIGGSPDCCGKSQTAAVEIYDPGANRWTTGAPLPVALQTSAAASVNGKIYVFGGFIPGVGVQNTTFEYDPDADPAADPARRPWVSKKEMRTARDQAPAVVVGKFIYVLGGSVECHCTALGDNDEYEPESQPELTCTKSGPSSVAAGTAVTYTIRVRNEGSGAATGVKVSDPTPSGLVVVNNPCRNPSCGLGTIPPGESRSVQVTFRAPACPTVNPVTNQATASADGVGPIDCNPVETALVVVPQVTCEKSGPPSAKVGDVVTYEVTASNPGCTRVRDVTLSDPTPPGLKYVSGPCVLSPCSLGAIDPGEPAPPKTLKFRVLEGCREEISNVATVTGRNADGSTCEEKTPLVPDLVVKVDAPPSVSGGTEFPATVTVSNSGPITAQGVLDVTIIGADAVLEKPADCEAKEPGRFTCPLAKINCGLDEKLVFKVRAPECKDCTSAPGPITTTATLTTADADPSNNQDSAETQVTCPPPIEDLAIEKKDDPDPVAPGEVLHYTITATNKGCATTAKVTDMFPDLEDIRWCRDAGFPCIPNLPPPLEETISLPTKGSATYRVEGTVSAMLCGGMLTNTAKIEGPPGFLDVHPEDNSSTAETTIDASGVKALWKDISGSFIEGGAITYTIVLLNCGPAFQADNPGDEFSDPQPAGLTFVSAAASSGAVILGDPITWNGSIPVGGMVTITIGATIGAGTAGMTLCNQATIMFDADGNGTNESMAASDNPNEPGPADPCCFRVRFLAEIPVLALPGLLALALLLAASAVLRLRRRSP